MRWMAGAWVAAALFGCGPECGRYDVLRIDLTRATGEGPVADRVYSEGAGGLKVQTGTFDPNFTPLETAVFGAATSTGTARITANFGSDYLLLLELPFPRQANDRLTIEQLLTDVRFTGGYEGYGWWDSSWRWRASPGKVQASLLALFEESQSATSVSGSVTIAEIEPLAFDLALVVEDRAGRTQGVHARAIAARALGQELCGP